MMNNINHNNSLHGFLLLIFAMFSCNVWGMPPAPPGPYQSIEDEFQRNQSSALRRADSYGNQAQRHMNDWQWGTPKLWHRTPVEPSRPRSSMPSQSPSYPPVRHPGYVNGVLR